VRATGTGFRAELAFSSLDEALDLARRMTLGAAA